MKASTLVGGSVLTSLVGGMVQLIGAPSGAVLAVVVIGLLFTFILGLAQVVMPQESQDKVLLWGKVLAYRERRRNAMPLKKKSQPHRAPGASAQDTTVVALPRSATRIERTSARSP
jgi:hypothetical protein